LLPAHPGGSEKVIKPKFGAESRQKLKTVSQRCPQNVILNLEFNFAIS